MSTAAGSSTSTTPVTCLPISLQSDHYMLINALELSFSLSDNSDAQKDNQAMSVCRSGGGEYLLLVRLVRYCGRSLPFPDYNVDVVQM